MAGRSQRHLREFYGEDSAGDTHEPAPQPPPEPPPDPEE